jgi:hypothetical protein
METRTCVGIAVWPKRQLDVRTTFAKHAVCASKSRVHDMEIAVALERVIVLLHWIVTSSCVIHVALYRGVSLMGNPFVVVNALALHSTQIVQCCFVAVVANNNEHLHDALPII